MHPTLTAGKRAMSNLSMRPLVTSALIGAILWLPFFAAEAILQSGRLWSMWFWLGYPALLVCMFFVGYRSKQASWLDALVALASSYLIAILVIPGTGNMLPFEIALVLLLVIPAAVAVRMGRRLQSEKRGGGT